MEPWWRNPDTFDPERFNESHREDALHKYAWTKVVRHALQDASSVAGLLITTEAMVAEKPEPKGGMPAMPPGGGMGGMDF